MNNEDRVPYSEKVKHLEMCNCLAEGRIDPEEHSRFCRYRQWWVNRNAVLNQQHDEHSKE